MTTYQAPLDDIRFALDELAGLDDVAALPGFEHASRDLVDQVLEEAGKLASGVLAPLNWPGDQHGARLEDGKVVLPPGWQAAFDQLAEGGWIGLACDPEHGGQGLPFLVSAAVSEMWQASNLAFGLCNLLTLGAIDALELVGTPEQKALYLPKLVSGAWTGTMNLTEPQAGSDLAAIRTKAVPDGDRYRISGQKIFITYGDHEMTENIVHLVLARLPDAPAGVKGISLFVVPKFLPNPDGSLGERNDLRCVSLEHKLGIHASPTAVMSYGDGPGAIGWLVGEPNRGLEYMFIMMNRARYEVGVQGLGISEIATQRARAFAHTRVQGPPIGQPSGAPIAYHPDVRRMLATMSAETQAMRGLAYVCAAEIDRAAHAPDPAARAAAAARVGLLIPIVKGWSTERSIEIASTGVQIHGGMGFIEETGAAQHLRDARITTIYEGTTGIQANDLVFRKTARDGGAASAALLDEIGAVAAEAAASNVAAVQECGRELAAALASLRVATDWIVAEAKANPARPAAGAVPYLMAMGALCGGWQMTRAALAAARRQAEGAGDAAFLAAKLAAARLYALHCLPTAPMLARTVIDGADAVLAAA